jgi:chromosomal replication initiator protein
MQVTSTVQLNTYTQDNYITEEESENLSQSVWQNIFVKVKLDNNQNTELLRILGSSKFIEIRNNILYFSVKDNFDRETLVRNYFFIVKNAASSIDNNIKMISISVDNSIGKENKSSKEEPFKEITINQKYSLANNIFSKANPKYTFNNYIAGESNIVAYKVTKDIATNNIDYNHNNVFYIHSHVGMGKTHLLQSIVNEMNKKEEGKDKNISNCTSNKVGYLSAEKFMHNFVNAVKANTLFELRSKINEVDIFLMDDLQFICGKESTQKEFSYILNSLIESGKKVVIASSVDSHILELSDERTKSILRSSNTVYIEPSEYELRLKILNNYNKSNEIRLEENILKLIADKVTTSIRELEAGLNNLKTYLSISNKDITTENICKYIQNYIRSSNKKTGISGIINAVAKYYRISLADIVSKKRNRKLVIGRQIIAYLSKELTTNSLKVIGSKIGDRDHSTILYYINKLNKLKKEDNNIENDINNIRGSII